MLGDEFQQKRNVGRSNNRPVLEPLRGRIESISAKKSLVYRLAYNGNVVAFKMGRRGDPAWHIFEAFSQRVAR